MNTYNTKLQRFFGDEMVRDLAADADQDADPVTFHWLAVHDSKPYDVNHPPEEAAGALVFVRGDSAAKALSAWLRGAGSARSAMIGDTMEVIICHDEDEFPTWLKGHSLDSARMHIEDGDTVVCARRSDGEVQVVPDGEPLDADVITDLLRWAAGAIPDRAV